MPKFSGKYGFIWDYYDQAYSMVREQDMERALEIADKMDNFRGAPEGHEALLEEFLKLVVTRLDADDLNGFTFSDPDTGDTV